MTVYETTYSFTQQFIQKHRFFSAVVSFGIVFLVQQKSKYKYLFKIIVTLNENLKYGTVV